ncbi:hypothetical protein [Kineothrix sedimenti]|uniref:Uncharacterized protein n=1 Tax=Kineothrix sedimenti TaxID=3123317 RepID=A0ABZ3F2P8_9FIRM
MGYKDDDDDLPEAPPITMVTETFSRVIIKPESASDEKSNDDE